MPFTQEQELNIVQSRNTIHTLTPLALFNSVYQQSFS